MSESSTGKDTSAAAPASMPRIDAAPPAIESDDRALLDMCACIPDITLSRWACSPGKLWEPLRRVLVARRLRQGYDVDADIDGFDGEGWLLARRAVRPRTLERDGR